MNTVDARSTGRSKATLQAGRQCGPIGPVYGKATKPQEWHRLDELEESNKDETE